MYSEIKLISKVKAQGEEIFPILVTHMITQPDVEEYAHRKGIKRVYYSYEFFLFSPYCLT